MPAHPLRLPSYCALADADLPHCLMRAGDRVGSAAAPHQRGAGRQRLLQLLLHDVTQPKLQPAATLRSLLLSFVLARLPACCQQCLWFLPWPLLCGKQHILLPSLGRRNNSVVRGDAGGVVRAPC